MGDAMTRPRWLAWAFCAVGFVCGVLVPWACERISLEDRPEPPVPEVRVYGVE